MRTFLRPSLRSSKILPLLSSALVVFACSSSSSNGGTSSSSSSSSSSSGDPVNPDDGGSTSSSGNPATPDVNITSETMTVSGVQRSYILAVPVDYDAARKYPLVLSLHGDGGNGSSMQKSFSFDAFSKRDAIVAYPSGLNSTWDLSTAADTNTDMQFVKGLVDEIAGKYDIDKTRVLGQGYSSGAFMVNKMACAFGASLFRAIAPNAGGQPQQTACAAGPVAAFVFHGDADGTVEPNSGSYDAYFWATVMNGCQDPGTSNVDGAPVTPTQPSPCKKYDGCPAATPVTWCLFPGVGHVVAKPANGIAWDYFKALP